MRNDTQNISLAEMAEEIRLRAEAAQKTITENTNAAAFATQEVVKTTTREAHQATQDVVKTTVSDNADKLAAVVREEHRSTRQHVSDTIDLRQPLAWLIICALLAVVFFFGARSALLKPDLFYVPGIYVGTVERNANGDAINVTEVKDDNGNVVAYEASEVRVLAPHAKTVATIYAAILAILLALAIYFAVPAWRIMRREE